MRVWNISAALPWLLGLCALGISNAAAQDEPDRRQAARPPVTSSESHSEEGTARERDAPQSPPACPPSKSRSRGAPQVPPTCYFFDDFSAASLERRNWETGVGVTPTRDLRDQGRSVAAVRLGAAKRGVNRRPELRSVPIGLAGVPEAELSYTVQHHAVEPGERLLVEYLSADGRWLTIERVVADARDSFGFSRHMRALPQDGLHGTFRVRFRWNADDEDDAWYLGEVSVVGSEPLYTLTVRVRPARSARVEVVPALDTAARAKLGGRQATEARPRLPLSQGPAGASEHLDGTAPFTRSLPVGTPVHLVAPPAVDGRVFSHWSVDGVPRADRQRVLTVEISESLEAVAHYRPWVSGRSVASVAVVSVPEAGVPITLGPDPERLYTHVNAEMEYRCLTGEWLALLAPPRTERLAFAGWVVNGQMLPSSDNLLEHRVTGDDVLLAEYVLLGDMNGDGELDKFDVDVFVGALIDPLGYAEQYPDLDRVLRGDVNGDGVFDALDVESFVDLLLND